MKLPCLFFNILYLHFFFHQFLHFSITFQCHLLYYFPCDLFLSFSIFNLTLRFFNFLLNLFTLQLSFIIFISFILQLCFKFVRFCWQYLSVLICFYNCVMQSLEFTPKIIIFLITNLILRMQVLQLP